MKYLAVLITSSALLADFDLPGRTDISEFRRPTPVETQMLPVAFRSAPPIAVTQLLAAPASVPVVPEPTQAVIALSAPEPSLDSHREATPGPATLRPRARPFAPRLATLRPRLRPDGSADTRMASVD